MEMTMNREKSKWKSTSMWLLLLKKESCSSFEDETTITQKLHIRKSMSFEGEQEKIEHTGNRKKFSAYISMV
jgi:hypothetical protein